jgi:hypothetical protein
MVYRADLFGGSRGLHIQFMSRHLNWWRKLLLNIGEMGEDMIEYSACSHKAIFLTGWTGAALAFI